MQNTLLGLAIALILALVAALVGPYFVDWGTYRSVFESQATQLVGVPVKVTGSIDARLLPAPQLTLRDIEIGDGDGRVRARSLDIELALGPLMRGEWRASEMHLTGPQITLGVDASGHVKAPSLAVAFDPDALTIERLSVNDGTLTLADANGTRTTLEKVWFNGEAKSLLGPFKGEGAVTFDGELYPYRVSAGRYSGDTGLKLRVNVDPVARPLAIELDGALALAGAAPRFEGNISITRPASLLRGSQMTQPWKITSKLKAGPQSALMQNLEFLYGSEEQGIRLTGVADIAFGRRPRFDGVLSSRQVDLDRALVNGDGQRPTPSAALRTLVELGASAFRPAIPVQLGVAIDQITLGGSTVQNLRGDISSRDGGWNLDRFEFRAPGFTQVKVSGRLAVEQNAVSFTGPAEIESGDPRLLTAWLEGRGDAGHGDVRPLSLRGELTVGTERIAVEGLTAAFDRKSISGRLAYVFATARTPARLDAVVNAQELDIDSALSFGKALAAGSTFQRPKAITIAADIGRATVAGFTGRNASARLKIDGDGVEIDKLSVADLGGAAFSANGRIVTSGTPQGTMRVDLDAPDVKPVLALLSRFAPETAQALERHASAMAPAKLRGQFSLQGAQAAPQGKFELNGQLGKVQLMLNGQGRIDAETFAARDVQLDGKLNADDGAALVAMLGLHDTVAVARGAGSLTVKAAGQARGEMRVEGRLAANGLEVSATGTAKPFASEPTADLRVAVVRANVAPLRGGVPKALTVTYASRVQLAGSSLTLSDINAGVDGATLRGTLTVALPEPRRVQGEIVTDVVDVAALTAAAVGAPASIAAKGGAWAWSSEPFGDALFGSFNGRVAVTAHRMDLLPRATVREVKATFVFDNNAVAIENLSGALAGGKLGGRVTLRNADDGLKLDAKLALTSVEASALVSTGARPPVTGDIDLSLDVEGRGRTPIALIGSLQGKGAFAISDAQFAGLDPRAFDVVAQAVDQGLSFDNARISDIVRRALDSGRLAVAQAKGELAIGAGQVRVSDMTAKSKDATMALSGSIDLTDGTLDARVVLSGAGEVAGVRPDIFMALGGTVAAPAQTIDVSALSGWLTLRAVENQARRLREIERAAPKLETHPPTAAAGTAPPLSPAPAPPAVPTATPIVDPGTGSVRAKEEAPALPPPLNVSPYPAPSAGSVGAQN